MEIPVVRLREQDLGDIPGFVEARRAQLAPLGMVKLVAPRSLTSVGEDFDMTIPAPIMQAVTGTGGVYKLNLVDIEPQSARLFSMFARQEQPTGTSYEELEERFWSGLSARRKTDAPVYGADVPGSLFDACNASVSFQGGVNSVLRHLKKDVPGITSPMLYFGTFGSMFGIHKEDMDLYSINYLHEGAPKQWYLIPPSQAHQVESVCHLEYPMDAQECSEFIRHKNCMLSPKLLRGYGLHVYTARQEPGEFIVTFPRCYHFGFNYGANIAESVNFATPDWFEIGKRAKWCTCSRGNVRFDVEALEKEWRKATGQITPVPRSPPSKPTKVSPAKVGRSIQAGFTTKRAHSAPSSKKAKPRAQAKEEEEEKEESDEEAKGNAHESAETQEPEKAEGQHAQKRAKPPAVRRSILELKKERVAATPRNSASRAAPVTHELVLTATTAASSVATKKRKLPIQADQPRTAAAAAPKQPSAQRQQDQKAKSSKPSPPVAEPKQSAKPAPAGPTAPTVQPPAVDVGGARNRRRTNKLIARQQIDIFLPESQRWVPCMVLEKDDTSTKALVQFSNGDCDLIDENEVVFRQRYV